MADPDRLVPSSAAARALGVDRSTLWRWQRDGLAVPEFVTAGGQARWHVERLRRQLAEHREPLMSEPATKPEKEPVVAAIVTSDLGVLVGRRNDGIPPWTFIAGKIEPGESPADAAVREVKEETGLLVVSNETEIGRRVHPKTNRTMIYLACRPTEGTEVYVGDTDELAEVRWIGLAEVDELLPGLFQPVRDHLEQHIRIV